MSEQKLSERMQEVIDLYEENGDFIDPIWVQFVGETVDLEARLKAMERVLDEISELTYGQGHAAVRMAAMAIGRELPDAGSLAAV